ncbi:UDP-N-acetylmuramyl pentapeptide phosphotransferase/UDP-N-acetylglucosamine-1-phosphate transferase [Methylobacterium sp. 174MFSha1.1]|uniref:MraY family glycosyltransferase n=1 Tax=Methylobacterium sp. 174MFSha1.1 TaxID=1502749 RepID=UPI0008E4AA92|nr:glycosyltransferase family 4 protein [Methylobacterium sp. 174MFSha1.1]SFU94602.1 UDP-N-acetylmuramyl pentapeptide phosphotransferase/UDP-N-acetylglucosamine-1-phosphate transferase [Methylobacterium sp. 174MFSha1.1]
MPLSPLVAVPLAALLSSGLIIALRPLLQRYALARPNARSSHRIPTPQGGGIAVVAAALAAMVLLGGVPGAEVAALATGAVVLGAVGAVDDLRPLPVRVRLPLQAVCVVLVLTAAGGQLVPGLPLWLERGLAVLAGLWFVNLTNFMDGLDWMTVAEMVPVLGALLVFGLAGRLPTDATLAAAALLGGLLGFAPFNRPVAKLFLGDVGSLPIGLVVAWLLYRLAGEGGLAAAILLPLYYLADATLTLGRRALAGEPVWQAHRSHFYQRATTNGRSVPFVVGAVLVLNLALALLAAATLAVPGWTTALLALALGAGLVAGLLRLFALPAIRNAAA